MILVTGATGNVGRRALEMLLAQGREVRATSRAPERATWPAGVPTVALDLADPASLATALEGVEAVFLFAAPGCGPGFVAAAEAAGVRRVVLLSSGSVDDESEEQDGPIAAYHAEIERALRGSTLEWTFLRPDVFAANTLMWAGQTKGGGDVVRGAYAEATAAPIHEADIAAVAVAALTEDGHAGEIHRLTGPQSLTHADQAQIIGEVLGRPVTYQELPAETVREAMSAHVPGPVLDDILKVWADSAGRPALVTADVEKITGRAPRSYRDWVSEHAAAF
ncbi:NAD(P)H-binding protein [Streptomyces sp. ID05-04B]|uniref:NAD(P)H-binding protein n=1 Tax=Streptomyces sp. ID05-04B TaxID=3028661 RepID=UPI0029C4D0F4|nr:NAD(P)H-binding protein [Streptomyces sp. ID05-04B]MDX5565778.1 NAD(P)H-binding protein [Streptomyces sp. ID05-04B]